MKSINRKGAVELSVGTMVIIVLAMSMLILGLVLVRNIFSGATSSVDTINDKVQSEISNLFGDEQSNVVIKLGSDMTAKVKAGTESFGVAIGAQTNSGGNWQGGRYQISVSSLQDCENKLTIPQIEKWFITPINRQIEFNSVQDSRAFGIIKFKVPAGTPTCTPLIKVEVFDGGTSIGSNSFYIEVLKASLFG